MMDSCQIFSFLFGTRKATSELRKCFSSKLSEVVNSNNKDQRQQPPGEQALPHEKAHSHRGAVEHQSASNKHIADIGEQQPPCKSAPVSPIKQIQLKLSRLASGATSKLSSQLNDDFLPQKQATATTSYNDCGTYRAILVEHIGNDDGQQDYCIDTVDLKQNVDKSIPISDKQQIDKNILNELDSGEKLIVAQQILIDQPIELTNNGVEKSRGVDNEGQAQLSDKRGLIDGESARRVLFADKKNEKVRHLVQSFELNANATLPSIHDNNSARNSPIRKILDRNLITSKRDPSCIIASNDQSLAQTQNQSRTAPTTAVVKPLPPKTPPKSIKAKCINWQLNLDKPLSLSQLFQDEQFLGRLFDQMDPLDRCSAAQVCRNWRNVLYANQDYWKDLVNVIDCTQLRREHIVDCILNTLNQSSKLKQHQHHQNKQQINNSSSVCSNNHYSLQNYCNTVTTIPRYNMSNEITERDQDEMWRIQELCNRFSQRSFGHQGASSTSFPLSRSALINPSESQSIQLTPAGGGGGGGDNSSSSSTHDFNSLNNQQHQQSASNNTATTCRMINSKSSSIPSQISSTLSSISLSSLLSPLSESSRVESLREKLYTSMDNRGFDALCLFGAIDEDVEDLTAKTPQGARKRIRVGRLNNCCITDRGLDLFLTTFNQIDELELTGCNELTNAIDLRPLKNLTRLTITDCINIADGLAQRFIQIVHQLSVFVIQAYHLTDAFMEYVSLNADTSKLKRLELLNCKELTNQSMLIIAKHFQQLDTLSISGSTKISDDGIELLTEQTKSLRCLDLSWCTKITDASLECIACDLSANLTELILDRNAHITDVGLGYLSTMNKLELVHIRWCSRITDIGLEALLTAKSLKYLSLAGLHQITARSLLCLIELADTLLEVELTNCPAVNRDLLSFLEVKMPRCSLIY